MYIKRKLEDTISRYLNAPEVLALVGPRQCGKTTLIKEIAARLPVAQILSFEDRDTLSLFERDIKGFAKLYCKTPYLFIDEFQYAREGGKKLKYLYDEHHTKIIITGSSSIDLTVQALKYLVGRIFIFQLYPFDFQEFLSWKAPHLSGAFSLLGLNIVQGEKPELSDEIHDIFLKLFEEYVLFGGYPRVLAAELIKEKQEVLKNIYSTYFLRDVRDIMGLIDDYKFEKLIKALGLQIGNLIDYSELGILSEYSYVTLKKMLSFLEKTFICALMRPYFTNKRKELVKNPKVYYFDTGLRNSVVNDFRALDARTDSGALLENALFQECVKHDIKPQFWRTKTGSEVDFIIAHHGVLIAIEVKKGKTNDRELISFQKMHPNSTLFTGYWRGRQDTNSSIKVYPLYCMPFLFGEKKDEYEKA
ncbi:MAG: ATP-binding protein [Candidatus Uhrbacteria bacterium]|nr:ATP-binding protein [Candidatus Uhrbacteria bacterium]